MQAGWRKIFCGQRQQCPLDPVVIHSSTQIHTETNLESHGQIDSSLSPPVSSITHWNITNHHFAKFKSLENSSNLRLLKHLTSPRPWLCWPHLAEHIHWPWSLRSVRDISISKIILILLVINIKYMHNIYLCIYMHLYASICICTLTLSTRWSCHDLQPIHLVLQNHNAS